MVKKFRAVTLVKGDQAVRVDNARDAVKYRFQGFKTPAQAAKDVAAEQTDQEAAEKAAAEAKQLEDDAAAAAKAQADQEAADAALSAGQDQPKVDGQ